MTRVISAVEYCSGRDKTDVAHAIKLLQGVMERNLDLSWQFYKQVNSIALNDVELVEKK